MWLGISSGMVPNHRSWGENVSKQIIFFENFFSAPAGNTRSGLVTISPYKINCDVCTGWAGLILSGWDVSRLQEYTLCCLSKKYL